MPSNLWKRIDPWKAFRLAVFYGGLFLAWYLLAAAEVWEAYVFPSPGEVWSALERIWDQGRLQEAIQTTLQRMAIGYALSIAVGLTIGIAMGTLKWVDETVGTLVLGIQSLPSVTWFPLAVLWFGLNERAIIFVVLMGSVGSVAISARSGVRAIPPLQMRAARMFGGHPWQLYTLVVIPGMHPALVQGLKLGWSFAWRSLLAAELLFVSVSLGYLLNVGRELNNVSLVVGVMLVIVSLGLLIDRLVFARLEAWIARRWGFASA